MSSAAAAQPSVSDVQRIINRQMQDAMAAYWSSDRGKYMEVTTKYTQWVGKLSKVIGDATMRGESLENNEKVLRALREIGDWDEMAGVDFSDLFEDGISRGPGNTSGSEGSTDSGSGTGTDGGVGNGTDGGASSGSGTSENSGSSGWGNGTAPGEGDGTGDGAGGAGEGTSNGTDNTSSVNPGSASTGTRADNGAGGSSDSANRPGTAQPTSTDLCGNTNQCSVSQALDALNQAGVLAPDSTLGKAIQRIQDEQQADLYNTLSGEVYASVRSVLLGNQRLRNAVQARMLGLDVQRLALAQPVLLASNAPVALQSVARQRLWADAWGYDGHTDADRRTAKTDHSGLGLALGGDAFVTDNLALGLMLGYEDGKVKSGGTRHSRVDVKSYSVGAYASADLGGVDLRGGLLYSRLDLESRRNLTALGLGTVKADYKGHKVQAFAEIAKAFALSGSATLSPYANLTHTWLHTDATRERGSDAALRIQSQNENLLQSTLGVRGALQLSSTTPVSLTANLGWQHAFGSNRATTSNTLSYNGASSRFNVEGIRQDRDRALVGVGVQAQLTANATLSAGYDGQFGSKYRDHAGSVQFKLKF